MVAPETLLAADRMLFGYEPEPCREIARPPEVPRRRGERSQCRCDQRADPGDRHQSPRNIVFARPAGNLGLEPGDPIVEVTQAIHVDLRPRPRRLGQIPVGRPNHFDQAAGIPRPLGDLPELGRVAPQGVDRLRALSDQQLAHAEPRRSPLLLLALTGTNRMLGRCAASQMASASAASFFWRRTNGLT